MKKILTLLVGMASLLMLASCERSGEIVSGGDEVSSGLRLRLAVDGLSTQNTTRSTIDPIEGENHLNTLYLLFFEKTDDMSGSFVDYIEIENPVGVNTTFPLLVPDGSEITAMDSYSILGIGNIHDNKYIDNTVEGWMSEWVNKSERYVREKAFAWSTNSESGHSIVPRNILMFGNTAKESGTGLIDLTLFRNVSRFDVKRNVSVASGYEIVSASVWNAYPKESIFGDGVLDYSADVQRIKRFYGYDNPNPSADIEGHLYAFENKVVNPQMGDKLTTCLIIGLRPDGGSDIQYYRVNVNPKDEAQNLKRNNAYVVTVTSVNNAGYKTEDEAYAGLDNQLGYTINTWNLDDNGLIVSDSNSLLAVPTKTSIFNSAGGQNTYSITTFSSLPSPSPLTIKSQIYENATNKIHATLDGNTLSITAEPLALGEDDRRGIITLSFAGLEALINVIQSADAEDYLRVTLAEDWTGVFPSTAGFQSDRILVNASGTWSATLVDEKQAFSFGPAATRVTEITSDNADYVLNSAFRIFTNKQNTENTPRRAFVIISLDSDPVNFASIVMLTQQARGAIDFNPDINTIAYKGNGDLISQTNTIGIQSYDSVGTPVSWMYEVEQDGNNDDRDRFAVTQTSDAITVTANDVNQSGRIFKIKIKISAAGEVRYIYATQASLEFRLSQNSVTGISNDGGNSPLIALEGGFANSVQWTADIVVGSTTTGKTVTNHKAYLVDENGVMIDHTQPQNFDKKFRVVMPKVYFPNRERNIVATVTVRLVESSMAQILTVGQNSLTSKGVHAWSSGTTNWGALSTADGHPYFRYFTQYLHSISQELNNPATINYGSTSGSTGENMSEKVTYMHLCNHFLNSSSDMTYVNDFKQNRDGIFLMMATDQGSSHAMAAVSALGGVYSFDGPRSGYTSLATSSSDNRVYQFIVSHGRRDVPATVNFYVDGYNTYATSYPADAVPIMNNSNGQPLLIIDIKNKQIYMGDDTIFSSNYWTAGTSTGRAQFVQNLVEYVCYAAMYGSHFTDLLLDTEPGDADYVAAPWDDVWGVNKWNY